MRTYINFKGQTCDFENEIIEGWREILESLYDDLVFLGWDTELHQVKEKFGGLRFYIGHGNDAIFYRIDEAEAMSLRTCMVCGKPGELRGTRWLYTSCEEHK